MLSLRLESAWPWLVFAGLGLFHGLNPAMGWLFAVALGLHRHSRRAVLLALPPLAAGHALAIGLVAVAAVFLGLRIDPVAARIGAGGLLLAWAGYHGLYGHRHRVRIGMTAGAAGLALWSFLMATAHGAGLMLLPALLPLCTMPGGPDGPLTVSLAAVAVHTLAMLAAMGAIALLVHDWFGVGFLRRGWINLDAVWTGVLAVTGLGLVVTA
ncbi:MAG: hypothetical protein ACJ8AW_39530 [Rhodopila sp.]